MIGLYILLLKIFFTHRDALWSPSCYLVSRTRLIQVLSTVVRLSDNAQSLAQHLTQLSARVHSFIHLFIHLTSVYYLLFLQY
jgi:hypothetical protein